MSEHIDRQKLFIREQRLMIIAQALLFKDGLIIVEVADEQVEFDKFSFHKTILSPLAHLLFRFTRDFGASSVFLCQLDHALSSSRVQHPRS